MERLSLKLFCIVIIALFCLAPLSAIDLNKSNKSANDNRRISDMDSEILRMNDTGSVRENEMNNENNLNDDEDRGLNVTKNTKENLDDELNETKNLDNKGNLSQPPNLRVNVEDVKVGEDVVIEVQTDKRIDGEHVLIFIQNTGQYPHISYSNGDVTLRNGYVKFTVPKKLPQEHYLLMVSYGGSDDEYFDGEVYRSEFNVYGEDSNLRIQGANLTLGEKAYAIINADKNFSENLNIKINNTMTPSQKLSNEFGIAESGNLTAGDYLANVCYNGHDADNASEANTTFTVKESTNILNKNQTIDRNNAKIKVTNGTSNWKNLELEPPNLWIEYKDENEVGQEVSIEIHANEKIDDEEVALCIYGFNDKYESIYYDHGSRTLKKGYLKYILPGELPKGNYYIYCGYGGNRDKGIEDDYTGGSFIVCGYNPNLSIRIDNITLGEKAYAIINANKTISKNVNVKINNSLTYSLKIDNGFRIVELEKLTAGDYLATVSYPGDDTFKASEAKTTFTIKERKNIPNNNQTS